MKVLVTGGAGYVGSHCVKLLCQRGHDVVVVDDLSAGHASAVDPKASLLRADVADRAALHELLTKSRFDGLIHLAGHIEVSGSVSEPLKYYHNNVAKTVLMLQMLEQVGLRRLVFSSTAAVYGLPQAVPISEDHPQNPISPYGRTKLVIEWMLQDCARAWGLGSIALRYFNAAGCAVDETIGEDHEPETHLIPRGMRAALGRLDQLEIYGTDYPTADGTCVRDYLHVDDLAEAHLRALETAEPGQARAYNVGTGKGCSVREVIDTITRITARRLKIVESPRRPGDPPVLLADASKIRQELAWKPRFETIDQIVQTAWQWFRSHPDGYGKSK